ncbi:MAG: hypothetical protein ACI4JZ_04035 [Oscillospiraceae bacterium]
MFFDQQGKARGYDDFDFYDDEPIDEHMSAKALANMLYSPKQKNRKLKKIKEKIRKGEHM